MASGRCDDCGGSAYTRDKGAEVCRDCHYDRANFIARNAHARASVLSYFSEEFGSAFREQWAPESLERWKSEAALREKRRAVIRSNLDAYARGDFPGDWSLLRGVNWWSVHEIRASQ